MSCNVPPTDLPSLANPPINSAVAVIGSRSRCSEPSISDPVCTCVLAKPLSIFPVDLIYYHEELLQELVDEHMQLLSFYKYSRGITSP